MALHAELLAYFVLLHADEPQTMLPELARTSPAVTSHAAVTRALRVAASLGAADVPAWVRAVAKCSLLENACVMRLLPIVRGMALQQANAAYLPREAVPTAGMAARLLLPANTDDATRLVTAHGLKGDENDPPGHVRFKAAAFVLPPPSQPYEPPLAPPALPQLQEWRGRKQREAAAAEAPAAASITPLSEDLRQQRKAKRRPPPKSLLAEDGDAAAAETTEEAEAAPAAAEPPSAAPAAAPPAESVRDATLRMLVGS